MEGPSGILHNVLEAERLGKQYGEVWLFRNLSFSIEHGQRLAIVGRNGSGKSTLLKLLAGLIPPSEGRVVPWQGELGYAALDGAVYHDLTVAEHLEFGADLRGCEARTSELMSAVGLKQKDALAGTLSTGLRARLKLAMALQARPQFLLLDEPGAGLDEAGRSLIASVIAEQCREGAAIIATNDPAERAMATHELDLDN